MADRGHVYLLQGPEEGEKALYIDKLIKAIRTRIEGEPEVLRHYAFEANIVDLIALISSDSLFMGHTLLVLHNAEDIKKADDLSVLCDYLDHPSPNATLVLTTPTIKQVSKKILDRVPSANNVIFWELFENQRKGWLTNFFRNHDMRIEPSALDLFLDMVGSNTRDFRQECNKLVLFFGPGTVITCDELEKYLYRSKEENVFTLFERIAERDFEASLDVLQKVLDSGESDAIQITSGLLWQVQKLQKIKQLAAKNYRMEEIFPKLGILSKKNQKIYIEAAKRYSLDDITSLIVLLVDLDLRVRSHKTELHGLLLQMFLYYGIERHGRMPEIRAAHA